MNDYRMLGADEITPSLFQGFIRTQNVSWCRRKVNGVFTRVYDPFIDDWTKDEIAALREELKETVRTGGCVIGAFEDGKMMGFASAESALFGSSRQYIDMTNLHVSADARGKGIGRALFCLCADWARAHDAKKLYLSAHSAEETQAFYARMGCTEAAEYSVRHTEKEPCDCQMEYEL